MDKHYAPAGIEAKWYAHWESSGAFRPSDDPAAEPFCIVIPPPNVTGSLHVGHALNNTLQDILCRFARLRGRAVLWQPGTDHAGIATQMVVERQLAEKGLSRHELGRAAFIERVWRWKEESGGTIVNQLKRLGASADWSRERFTMDEGLSKAVLKVFVDYYRQGLIYKDIRLVNWDPELRTAISDLEVEQREVDGNFWHIAYPVEDSDERIVVATTRPETMLGDTAVAVHPKDERYAHLVGRNVRLPLADRPIPIIADEHADPEQGSGAVKITPAHDFNDFEVGRRHDLPMVNIFDERTRLNENAPEQYRGLDRYEARKRVVVDLEAQGLLVRVEPKRIMMPYGDRSGVVIEPWLTNQWYVDAKKLAEPAIEAVREGRTRFVPANWEKTYFQWMENIQPWCISRQLWWGHRIPAWYGPRIENGVLQFGTESPSEATYPPSSFRRKPESRIQADPDTKPTTILDPGVRRGDDRDVESTQSGSRSSIASGAGVVFNIEEPFVAESDEDAARQANDRYGRDIDIFDSLEDALQHYINVTLRGGSVPIYRDPDVLDTWFSSALWPFSTLGWPEETPELARFYPTSTLVTGFDIIFFWVARMMMSGLHFMDEVPFRDVYITSLVRDAKGEKMSKSKGNVIDPLDFIEKYGADALRFTLAALETQGRDIKLAEARVEGYRNFGTKLWNAARLLEMNGVAGSSSYEPPAAATTLNRWILGETGRAAEAVTQALEAYRFDTAANAIYRFTWGTFCDWYLELIKPTLMGADGPEKEETRAIAGWVLDQILVLLHPFMPFITEELWHAMAKRERDLIVSRWPVVRSDAADGQADAEIGWLMRLVEAIRSARSEVNVPAAARVPALICGAGERTLGWLDAHHSLIERLARLERIEPAGSLPESGAVQIILDEAVVALKLEGILDFAEERARLGKAIEKAEKEIRGLESRLANEQFLARAPAEVVEEARTRLADEEATAETLRAALARLG